MCVHCVVLLVRYDTPHTCVEELAYVVSGSPYLIQDSVVWKLDSSQSMVFRRLGLRVNLVSVSPAGIAGRGPAARLGGCLLLSAKGKGEDQDSGSKEGWKRGWKEKDAMRALVRWLRVFFDLGIVAPRSLVFPVRCCRFVRSWV